VLFRHCVRARTLVCHVDGDLRDTESNRACKYM
jgi:hypothetical protein